MMPRDAKKTSRSMLFWIMACSFVVGIWGDWLAKFLIVNVFVEYCF